MKKKRFRIVLLFVVVLATICVVPTLKSNLKSVVAADSKYEISIDPKNKVYYHDFSYPNDAGAVYFTISISKAVDTDVDVYYETRDKSAIASSGDYTAKSSFATIPKNETSVDIVIYVGRAEFAVKAFNGDIHSREFEVVLTNVVGLENFEYKDQIGHGMIGYNYLYQIGVAQIGDYNQFSYLKEYEKVEASAPITTDEIDGEGEVSVNYDFSSTALYNQWENKFINTGLADLYATFSGKIDDWGLYTYWSYAELKNANNETVVGLKSHGYYDNHPLNPNNYGHADYGWYEDVYSTYESQTRYVDELCCDCKNKFTTDNSFSNMHCNFYKVNSEPNYTLSYRSEGGRDRKLVDTSIYSTLIDTKAPVLENAYIVLSKTTGDKLRIALRFNEPVYVVGSQNPTLRIRINADWNTVTNLVFAGGNYTDTLYFEIDYANLKLPNEKITSISVLSGSGIINDLGYRTARNAGETPHYVNNTLNLLNIPSSTVEVIDVDLRTPQLEITSENVNSIQKQHSVTVNVSNVDLEDSKLYFSWEETSSDIKNLIKNKNYYGSASETNTIIGGGYSGKRYLHVYVETKYGRNSYAVYDTALAFDNIAPTLTVNSVDGGYKTRAFNITVSDNFTTNSNSGIKAVYMYYRKELTSEYTTVEIKNYGKKVYDDTFTYQVTATDLGISETGNSNVKLGFYAVDYLGNKLQIDYNLESEEYLFDNGNTMLCLLDSINEEDGHNVITTNYYDTYLIKKNI